MFAPPSALLSFTLHFVHDVNVIRQQLTFGQGALRLGLSPVTGFLEGRLRMGWESRTASLTDRKSGPEDRRLDIHNAMHEGLVKW